MKDCTETPIRGGSNMHIGSEIVPHIGDEGFFEGGMVGLPDGRIGWVKSGSIDSYHLSVHLIGESYNDTPMVYSQNLLVKLPDYSIGCSIEVITNKESSLGLGVGSKGRVVYLRRGYLVVQFEDGGTKLMGWSDIELHQDQHVTQKDYCGIESPSHYDLFEGIESIEVIARSMTEEAFYGFCLGNVIKYRLRAGKKESAEKDLAKAEFYRTLYSKHKGECYDK